ncbi:MAG: hypothetical protein ACRCX2_32340 [Paraclostridium sp.]
MKKQILLMRREIDGRKIVIVATGSNRFISVRDLAVLLGRRYSDLHKTISNIINGKDGESFNKQHIALTEEIIENCYMVIKPDEDLIGSNEAGNYVSMSIINVIFAKARKPIFINKDLFEKLLHDRTDETNYFREIFTVMCKHENEEKSRKRFNIVYGELAKKIGINIEYDFMLWKYGERSKGLKNKSKLQYILGELKVNPAYLVYLAEKMLSSLPDRAKSVLGVELS